MSKCRYLWANEVSRRRQAWAWGRERQVVGGEKEGKQGRRCEGRNKGAQGERSWFVEGNPYFVTTQCLLVCHAIWMLGGKGFCVAVSKVLSPAWHLETSLNLFLRDSLVLWVCSDGISPKLKEEHPHSHSRSSEPHFCPQPTLPSLPSAHRGFCRSALHWHLLWHISFLAPRILPS